MTSLEKLVGKNAIRLKPAKCSYGEDKSYCLSSEKEYQDWVHVTSIDNEGKTYIQHRDSRPKAPKHYLDPCWNDGEWVEWDIENNRIIPVKIPHIPRFDNLI